MPRSSCRKLEHGRDVEACWSEANCGREGLSSGLADFGLAWQVKSQHGFCSECCSLRQVSAEESEGKVCCCWCCCRSHILTRTLACCPTTPRTPACLTTASSSRPVLDLFDRHASSLTAFPALFYYGAGEQVRKVAAVACASLLVLTQRSDQLVAQPAHPVPGGQQQDPRLHSPPRGLSRSPPPRAHVRQIESVQNAHMDVYKHFEDMDLDGNGLISRSEVKDELLHAPATCCLLLFPFLALAPAPCSYLLLACSSPSLSPSTASGQTRSQPSSRCEQRLRRMVLP
eukprot:768122-Hanusia_phi.AAC.2